jgi:phosphoserine phosphatase
VSQFVYFNVFDRTAEAMGGNMTFQEALKKRLDIIRPTVRQIRDYIEEFPVHLTPGIK